MLRVINAHSTGGTDETHPIRHNTGFTPNTPYTGYDYTLNSRDTHLSHAHTPVLSPLRRYTELALACCSRIHVSNTKTQAVEENGTERHARVTHCIGRSTYTLSGTTAMRCALQLIESRRACAPPRARLVRRAFAPSSSSCRAQTSENVSESTQCPC